MEQKENKKGSVTKKEKKKKSQVWKWATGFFVILIIVVVLLVRFLASPKSGVVRVIEPSKVVKKGAEFERFEGKTLSFSRNSDYAIKEQSSSQDENGVVTEMAYLSGTPDNPKKIALTVENMTDKVLVDNANYNLRKVYPKTYHEEKMNVGEIDGIAFTNLSDSMYEKVVFIEHGKNLVTLALTAQLSSKEELDKEFENIVKSIQWKD